jgi:metallophosphoesterase superfamily enzyme
LHDDWYQAAGIELTPERLQIGEFAFIHDITTETESSAVNGGNDDGRATTAYSFSGHIHPGIRINGLGKQSLRFPCFYFGVDFAVLPAFSRFTGMASIYPAPRENVFAILPPSSPGRRAEAGRGSPGSIFQIQ